MPLTRWYLANTDLIPTKPAASETKHLSFLSTGIVPGLPRMPRSAGTQVPCQIKGIVFTHNLWYPLQSFRMCEGRGHHCSAVLFKNDGWQSLRMLRAGPFISLSLFDGCLDLWWRSLPMRLEVFTTLPSQSPATTKVLGLAYTLPLWVTFLSFTQF